MKTKRTLTIAAILVAVAILLTAGIFHCTRLVRAQDELGPPIHVRAQRNSISSGMAGLALGQTIRINVVNIGDIGCPCQRVILNFRDADGQLLRRSDGSLVQRSVELEPGRATSLDLSYSELPPSPIRLQLRASVRFARPGSESESGGFEQPPPTNDSYATTVEVFDSSNGRTDFAIYASGGFEKGR